MKQKMNKFFEYLGFVLEVNCFFWSGWLFSKGIYIKGFFLLLVSLTLAIIVGDLIHRRGISESINPAPDLFKDITKDHCESKDETNNS